MKIFGLTGGIGSGKSTVAKIFQEMGAPYVDADQVARELREPGKPAHAFIQKRFGTTDRLELRKILSSDAKAKKDLESILHPLIKTASDLALQELEAKHPAAPCLLYEASLLIEAGRVPEFSGIIIVTAPHPIRVDRVMARDALSSEAVNRLIQAQLSDEERSKHATYLIQNHGSVDELREQVRKVLDQIKRA